VVVPTFTERLADPVAERLDLVVRMGDLADSSLIATKLAPLDRVLVASCAYVEQYGEPKDEEALRHHRLLDKLHGNDLLGWSDILGCPAGEACKQVSFRSDDFEALNSAAISGMGVAFLPSWVSGASIQAGDLLRLKLDGERWNERSSGIYLLRALQVPPAKVRAFTEALRAHIGTPPRWS